MVVLNILPRRKMLIARSGFMVIQSILNVFGVRWRIRKHHLHLVLHLPKEVGLLCFCVVPQEAREMKHSLRPKKYQVGALRSSLVESELWILSLCLCSGLPPPLAPPASQMCLNDGMIMSLVPRLMFEVWLFCY